MTDKRFLTTRSSDGRFNSLEMPRMGCAGVRFGRNVPRKNAKQPTEEELMTPNPRLVSETFMKRTEADFKPATTLNLLAAAWIQFQVHDWFFHPEQTKENFHVKLADGDDWPSKDGQMPVPKSVPDEMLDDSDKRCPGYINTQTPWWDGSQLYGINEEMTREIRKGLPDGKLALDKEKTEAFLPRDGDTGLPLTGFNNNWWLGLEILHTLFALEHNAVCEMFRQKHPEWTG